MGKLTPRADGLYRIGIYLGKANGKPKYKYVYGATQKEAEQKASDVRARMKKGLTTNRGESFGVWAQRWLRLKKADVGNSMYQTYSGYVKRLADLEHIPISKVQAYDIQQIISELAQKNPRTNKPTAKKTLTDIRNTAAQIFQLAIENRATEYNPANAVRIPKSAPKAVRRALTEEEKQWIITTPHHMQTAAMIMLFAGLRRGEVIALQWDDIDLENRHIAVNKSVDLSAGKPVVKQTKTRTGMRVVDIPRQLVNYLAKQAQEHKLVCPSVSGKMYTVNAWKSSWESYMLQIDMLFGGQPLRKSKFDPRFKGVTIAPLTPHMFRHTYCTMLYFAGVDVLTAQQQMGHADAKTTLNIYTHLDAKHKRRAMAKLDEYLENG